MKQLFNIDFKKTPSSNDKYAEDREKNFKILRRNLLGILKRYE